MNTHYKYAVVDLEATSAGTNAQIIQIGIVIIENGRITERFATDVNPHEALDDHIIRLTGITDQQLAQAPEFSQVAGKIYELIQDAIFVAHNVKFDANLLAESLFWEGYELKTPRVDTVELAQTFFPTFDRYNLGALTQELGIELSDAHTAIADAQATAELLLAIQEKMRALPYPLLEYVLGNCDYLPYESYLAIQEVVEAGPQHFKKQDFIERHGIYLRMPQKMKKELKFSKDFSHNVALLDLEERTGQEAFSQALTEGLEQDKPVFIQAQMGLGKTYGYLLTLLAQTDAALLVTVPTKLLQDQIMNKEAVAIHERFGTSFASLKSPQNYLSLDKLYDRLQFEESNRLYQRFKMQLLIWLTETPDGDLDQIGQLQRYEPFVDLLRHDGKQTVTSLFGDMDFWVRSQERARAARVVITNQAYFLTRLEDDKTIVQDRILIVDEAQKLFLALEGLASRSMQVPTLLQEIHAILESEPPTVTKRLLESIQFELQDNFERLGDGRVWELDLQAVNRLRQDLSELDEDLLTDFRLLLSSGQARVWIERDKDHSHESFTLQSSRFDLLRFADFLPEGHPAFFISATLEISKRVHLSQLLGFRDVFAREIVSKPVGRQEIFLDHSFPDVVDLKVARYAHLIVERILDLASLGKPILVLFTSKELLLAVSEELTLPHLAQYKNGEAANIKKRFDRGETQIVLGAASFWEGTDFIHQDAFIQVITRLPFDNPKDVFVQKLNAYLKEEGKNPFYDYALPVAILRLRQAMGRVRRREDQESAVVLLDNRVVNKRYSPYILAALEKDAPVRKADFEEIVSVIGEEGQA